jgi:predicted nucleic acid-binding protein
MKAAVDANLVAALVLPLPYSQQATRSVTEWKQAGVELVAPLLLEYELSAVLRKAVVAGWLTTELAAEAMAEILALNIGCVPPTLEHHERALGLAERLGHSKTYDAHYLTVAEQTGAALWTADARLVSAARQAGIPWVHWIGE